MREQFSHLILCS